MSLPVVSGVTASGGAKVLITGGYLVLERANSGIVLSVDARLSSSLYKLGDSVRAVQNADGSVTVPLHVLTPQRQTAPFLMYVTYKYGGEGEAMSVEITGDVDVNPFVAKTVHTCLVSLSPKVARADFERLLQSGLLLVVRGARPFYASDELPNSNEAASIEKNGVVLDVLPVDNPADYTTKTGLGSSAALVSSLVGAFFAYFGVWESLREYAQRVAQFSHCAAQGKVGSGFDVSAAFLGTHVYNRFSPSQIQSLLDQPCEASTAQLSGACDKVHPFSDATGSQKILDMLDRDWDYVSTPFIMPPRLELMLGDVSGGSETPAMVKRVLAWHHSANKTVHASLWTDLAQANDAVYASLQQVSRLAQESPTEYNQVMDILAHTKVTDYNSVVFATPVQQSIFAAVAQLPVQFARVRGYLRDLGSCAGVPIEPDTQTTVLDQTDTLPGVLFSGVPGAGGYDAIFTITVDDQSGPILDLWRNTQPQQINRLPVRISNQQGVVVRQSNIETPASIFELL